MRPRVRSRECKQAEVWVCGLSAVRARREATRGLLKQKSPTHRTPLACTLLIPSRCLHTLSVTRCHHYAVPSMLVRLRYNHYAGVPLRRYNDAVTIMLRYPYAGTMTLLPLRSVTQASGSTLRKRGAGGGTTLPHTRSGTGRRTAARGRVT